MESAPVHELVRFERDLLYQSQRLGELAVKLERQDAQVDSLKLDVRQLVTELKMNTSTLQEVVKSLQDHRTITARLQTSDEAQGKAIDGIHNKGWAVMSMVVGSTMAALYSLFKH